MAYAPPRQGSERVSIPNLLQHDNPSPSPTGWSALRNSGLPSHHTSSSGPDILRIETLIDRNPEPPSRAEVRSPINRRALRSRQGTGNSPGSNNGSSSPGIRKSRDDPREEYDDEEAIAILYLVVVVNVKWAECEELFGILFPPGRPRRRHLDNSPLYVKRSEDGLTSKYYRLRNQLGLEKVRDSPMSKDEEKRVVVDELRRRVLAKEATREFLDGLKCNVSKASEYPLDPA